MPKKYKHKIGDWVEFKKYIKIVSQSGERYAYEVGRDKPIVGQICGAITRFIGDIKTHEWDYHSNSAYLVIRKSVTLYQVKDGMVNIPYEVKEEDIILEPNYSDFGYKLPWKNNHFSKMHKKLAREYAARQQRDSKGRFVYHMSKAVGG